MPTHRTKKKSQENKHPNTNSSIRAKHSSHNVWTVRILLVLVALRLVHLGTTRFAWQWPSTIQNVWDRATTKVKDLYASNSTFDEKKKNTISSIICTWQPIDNYSDPDQVQQTECFQLLQERLVLDKKSPDDLTKLNRWLFFGDSTMGYLFTESPLHQLLLKDETMALQFDKACKYDNDHTTTNNYYYNNNSTILECHTILQESCHLNQQFGLPPVSDEDWIQPRHDHGEGPVVNWTNFNCRECTSCQSHYTQCHLLLVNNNWKNTTTTTRRRRHQRTIKKRRKRRHRLRRILQPPPSCDDGHSSPTSIVYGGYFAIEFARDVQVQFLPQYPTTQEALVRLLGQTYNSLSVNVNSNNVSVKKPICVVSTGIHDMHIPGITLAIFLQNVKWYVALLLQECHHVIWLSTTSPKLLNDSDPLLDRAIAANHWTRFPQTRERVKEWNTATYQTFMSMETSNRRISIVDVFDASVVRQQAYLDSLSPEQKQALTDNVHMNNDWYHDLGSWFVQVSLALS